MNNQIHQQMVKQAVQAKFRGKEDRISIHTPKYPNSAERELKRVNATYMKFLHETLKEHLPEIMAVYRHERFGERYDDIRDVEREVREIIKKMAAEMERKMEKFGLPTLFAKVGNMVKTTSLREWKRIVRETLGVNMMDDYYKGDFYEDVIRRWTDENVLKIQSIPQQTLGEMQEIILKGFKEGKTIRDVMREIQSEYNVTKSKARFLARDQIGTLNAQITKQQQQDAGVTHYKWSDSRDGRVRDFHRQLNGKIFSWDDPPEMMQFSAKKGWYHTGRRCAPGEDFGCRCVALPVFNLNTVDIPIAEKKT